MAEDAKLQSYRKELIERLNACTQRPQDNLEYWLNEDDSAWLKSINVILDSNG